MTKQPDTTAEWQELFPLFRPEGRVIGRAR